jgi:hypothetical protein
LDGVDLVRLRSDIDRARRPGRWIPFVDTGVVEIAPGGGVSDEDAGVDLVCQRARLENPGEVEPLPAQPDPRARSDAVDPQPLGGNGAENGNRFPRRRGIEEAALSDLGADRRQQVEAGGLDLKPVRLGGGDQRAAVDLGVLDESRVGLPFDSRHALDHRRRRNRELGLGARERLTLLDSEQVRPEPIDLPQQPGLRGGGEAEHGDDRGDSDRDPERREASAEAPGAKPDARHSGEVGKPEP